MVEAVKLKLDEKNTLTFEVSIEGDVVAKPIYRLVCNTGDVELAFRGEPGTDGVRFEIPALEGRLAKGEYSSHLEVILENRLLVPLELNLDFSPALKAQVESVRVNEKADATTTTAKLLRTEAPVPSKPTVTQKKAQGKKPSIPKPAQKTLTLREVYELKKATK